MTWRTFLVSRKTFLFNSTSSAHVLPSLFIQQGLSSAAPWAGNPLLDSMIYYSECIQWYIMGESWNSCLFLAIISICAIFVITNTMVYNKNWHLLWQNRGIHAYSWLIHPYMQYLSSQIHWYIIKMTIIMGESWNSCLFLANLSIYPCSYGIYFIMLN